MSFKTVKVRRKGFGATSTVSPEAALNPEPTTAQKTETYVSYAFASQDAVLSFTPFPSLSSAKAKVKQEAGTYYLDCSSDDPATPTTYTSGDSICIARAKVEIYEGNCNSKTHLGCRIFQLTRYETYREYLRQLLSNRPGNAAKPQYKLGWLYLVLDAVSNALDATNIQPNFINMPKLAAFLGVDPSAFRVDPGQVQYWKVDWSGNVKDGWAGTTGKEASVEVGDYWGSEFYYFLSPDLKPCTNTSFRAAAVESDTVDVSAPCNNSWQTKSTSPIFNIFQYKLSDQNYVSSVGGRKIYRWAYLGKTTQEGKCYAFIFCEPDTQTNKWGWKEGAVAGWKRNVAYAEAAASDIIERSLDQITYDSYGLWLTHIQKYVDDGTIGLSKNDFKKMKLAVQAEGTPEAQQNVEATYAQWNASSSAGGKWGKVAVSVAIVVTSFLDKFLPKASGGIDCPIPPFKRSLGKFDPSNTDECSDCSINEVLGGGFEHIDKCSMPKVEKVLDLNLVPDYYERTPSTSPVETAPLTETLAFKLMVGAVGLSIGAVLMKMKFR